MSGSLWSKFGFLILGFMASASVYGAEIECTSSGSNGFRVRADVSSSLPTVQWSGGNLRKGSFLHDDLLKVVAVFFEDGRLVVEDGVLENTSGKFYGKLSIYGKQAWNLICARAR